MVKNNGGKDKNSAYRIIAQNKQASFNYFIEDEYEAGLVLLGTEIKSIREGKASIKGAFVDIDKSGECFLINSSIQPYTMAKVFNHQEKRKRKLLLNKREIKKILGKIKLAGYSCVPLVLYINNKNIAKIKIAICKGKKLYDKRETLKKRDWQREKAIIMKVNNRK